MKKILSIILIVFILASSCITAFTDDENMEVVTVIVNGRTVNSDPLAHIKEGRTMLPFRAVGEELGCDVTWNSDNKTVRLENGFSILVMQIDNKKITVKDNLTEEVKYYEIDVAPYIFNGRTFVPVRAITEIFDAEIIWESTTKTVTIKANYDKIENFNNGYARVKKIDEKDGSDKWGYINTKSEEIVEPKYDFLGDIDSNNLVKVGIGDKYGYIDMSNLSNTPIEPFIKCQYDSIEPIDGGFACFLETEYFRTSDTGVPDWSTKITYQEITPFVNGKAIAKNSDGKCGCINRLGDEIVKFEYDNIWPFSNGSAFATKDGKYYSINTKGVHTQIKYEDGSDYDEIEIKSNNIALVKKIKTVAEPSSDSAASSDEGEIEASSDGQKVKADKYGVINSAGKIVVPLEYDSPDKFIYDNVYTDVKPEEVTDENQEPQIKVTYTLWDNQKVYFTYPKDNVPEEGLVGVETNGGNIYYDINGKPGVFSDNTKQ